MAKVSQIRLFFGDERATITVMRVIRSFAMKRWYFAVAAVLLVSAPVTSFAQTMGNAGTGVGGGQGGGAAGTGLAGQANTTLLGANVDLNFKTVFGNGATLANTNTDPFSAYRPSGSGTGSSTGTGTTLGSSFSGGGFNTNTTGGTNRSGTGNLGTNNLNANRGGTLGTTGGFAGGGALGGNRNTMGGGFTGQQRGMMGGNTGGFLGGGMMGAMGGMNQQGTAPSMGYQVNYNGQPVNNITTTVTPSVDLQQRLSASPGMQGVSNLQVFLQGDTAILRGKVGSDYSKQLAAAMVRLEPGIYNVENQLEVAPAKP
jgi:hypothetical protein